MPAQQRPVLRSGSDHWRDADGDALRPYHLARHRAAVSRSHCEIRASAQCRDDAEPTRAGRGRCARPGARAGQGARAAPWHSNRAQGQHSYDRDAHDGRCAGVQGVRSALRGDDHDEPSRGGRCCDREDEHDRAGQLDRHRDAGELQRDRRLWIQSRTIRVATIPRRQVAPSAVGDGRRIERRRLELGRGHCREFLGGECGHGDIGFDPHARQPDDARRNQADGRAHQPLRDHSNHGRSGHGRADGQNRGGCGAAARCPRRPRRRIVTIPRRGRVRVSRTATTRAFSIRKGSRALVSDWLVPASSTKRATARW